MPAVREEPHRKLIIRIYAGAAVLILPWIVILYRTQPVTGLGHHLRFVSAGSAAFVTIGVAVTAELIRRRSPCLVVSAAATATGGFIVTWFHALTRIGSVSVGVVVTQSALVPIIGMSGWIAVRRVRDQAWDPPRWLVPVYLVAAAVLVVGTVRLARVTPSIHLAQHLRLIWTGLDVFEFTGLATTAWTCYRRSPAVPIAATATATLLAADAWFNVIPTVGAAHWDGVAMALVELPLAALSLWLAWPTTRVAIEDEVTAHGC